MFESVEKFFKKSSHPVYDFEANELNGSHVAMLATNGFGQIELFTAKEALEKAGAVVHIISLRPGKIKAWKDGNWGKSIEVDQTVREAWSMEFDSLVLPGGVLNHDKLRENAEAVAFVMSFLHKKRPIAAICHGIQTLIETGQMKGRTLTSWPSLRTDLANAGAQWVDKDVVVDGRLITGRRPSDIPTFIETMIREFTYHQAHSGLPNTEGFVSTL